jgi:predicted nuclease of predicted toxin-antitoxin system
VRFFIDECLSPQLAIRLNHAGRHDAVHPLHVGRRGAPDHSVLAWCIEEDRIMVTQNARDFRRLIGRTELHPGLIILPSVGREGTWTLLQRHCVSGKSRRTHKDHGKPRYGGASDHRANA